MADAYDTIGGGRPWPGRCEDMVREKVKTPATVSQAETAADQLSCSGVIPMCHPGSGFGGGKGYEPMWQEPGQGGSMEPQDTPLYHPPIVS